MSQLRVVFMGTPDFAVPALRALIQAPQIDVVAVFTQPDRKSGRGQNLTPPPVKVVALEHDVPVHQPEKLRNHEALQLAAQYEPDFLVVAAYGKILGKKWLELAKYGPINIHASLLPRLRGAAPIHWAITRGDAQTGIGIMRMEEGLDTGPVYLEGKTDIAPDDTASSVHDRLAELGAKLVVEALPWIASGQMQAEPQAETGATYAPMLTKADGAIRFDEPAEKVSARARGMHPWPGAYCLFREKRCKLLEVRVGPDLQATPGSIAEISDDALVVGCSEGTIAIRKLQVAGKSPQDAKSFAQGYRLTAGDEVLFTADPSVENRND